MRETRKKLPQAQVAAAVNGRIGGRRRAELHSAEERSNWARLGGLLIREKFGPDHFRKLRAERSFRDALRRSAQRASAERLKKFERLIAEASRVLEQEFGKLSAATELSEQ